jgi:membrane associated rhomboid family serine protease
MEVPWIDNLHEYPALTVGLTIFTFLLLLIDSSYGFVLSQKFSLYPDAILNFDLNRLSFYLLFHTGLFHYVLNIISLIPLLYTFEKKNGTIFTGITLNILTVIAGLQYSLVGHWLYPQEHIVGLSGIVFSFASYYAYKEHFHYPILYTFKIGTFTVEIPTILSPFIYLVLVSIMFSNSSFFGHLFAISSGFLLGLGYINFMYPPHKVIQYIETKLARPLSKLNKIVKWCYEEDSLDARVKGYRPLFGLDLEQPLVGTYPAENVLGTN